MPGMFFYSDRVELVGEMLLGFTLLNAQHLAEAASHLPRLYQAVQAGIRAIGAAADGEYGETAGSTLLAV